MHNKSLRFLCSLPIQYFLYLPAFEREIQRGQVCCLLCISWLNLCPAAGVFLRCFGVTMVFIDFFSLFYTLKTAVTPENDACRGYRCFCGGIKGVTPAHISITPILFPKQRNGMFRSQIWHWTIWTTKQNLLDFQPCQTEYRLFMLLLYNRSIHFLCNTWDYSFFLGNLSH